MLDWKVQKYIYGQQSEDITYHDGRMLDRLMLKGKEEHEYTEFEILSY